MIMNNKRGELATSTLILFLAIILITITVIFALVSRLGDLSSDSYQNLKLTEKFVSKGLEINLVKGADGRNGHFDEYHVTVQLLPDSKEISFDELQLSIQTPNAHAVLDFRNGTPTPGGLGYYTSALETLDALEANVDLSSIQINFGSLRNLNFDIDGDGDTNDFVGTCDSIGTLCDLAYSDSALIFQLSSAGTQYAWLNDTSGSLVDISPAGAVPIDIDYSPIGDGSYGFITTYDTKANFLAHTLTPTGPFYIYASPIELANDIDLDGSSDFIVTNNTHARVFPSSQKTSIDIPLGGDISGTLAVSISQSLVLDNGTTMGILDISGTATGGVIPADAITYTPARDGVGFFQIEYLLTSNNHLPDRMVRGESAKIYIDAPYGMEANDQIRFNFIVDDGVSFPVTVFTGHTITARQYIDLYPKI
jgi:archaellin